jgi:hypothetical protein
MGKMKSMRCITQRDLDSYLKSDKIAFLLNKYSKPGDEIFASQRWLLDSAPKRMLFEDLYGDLLTDGQKSYRILDVGGGVTGLTRMLAKHHDYHLLDIFAHDHQEALEGLRSEVGRGFWTNGDWYEHMPDMAFDIIIANDLFPNVDQRLRLFLDKALEKCREIRLSLTFYNNARYYLTQRIGAEEILCFLAFDGEQTAAVLSRFQDRIERPDFESLMDMSRPSLYSNGRQVAIAYLRGMGE